MIDIEHIRSIVNQQIDPVTEFVVDINISSGNRLLVLVDGDKGITIDRCVKISKAIEQQLDRDKEDFELEVSSPGLSMPLKVERQYYKNIGRDLEVISLANEKITGKLVSVNDKGFCMEIREMVKKEGKKRKELEVKLLDFSYADIKMAKVVISFR